MPRERKEEKKQSGGGGRIESTLDCGVNVPFWRVYYRYWNQEGLQSILKRAVTGTRPTDI